MGQHTFVNAALAYARRFHRKPPVAHHTSAARHWPRAAVVFCLALTYGFVTAAADTSAVPIVPGWFLKKADEKALQEAAKNARNEINKAKKALLAGRQPEAVIALDRALAFLDEAQKQLPTNAVQARLRTAKARLATEGSGVVLVALAPVYEAIEKLAGLIPADEAERYLRQAGGALTKGDTAAANEALDATLSVLVFPELERPLSRARTLVRAAKVELGLGNAAVGKAVLGDAEKALTYLEQALDNPLLEARYALGNAVQTYAVGDQADAMLDLDRAEDFLNQALETDASADADTLHALLTGVHTAKQAFFAGKADHRTLQHLWAKARALTERQTEHSAAEWGSPEAQRVIRFDLIEAKHHLQIARAARFLSGDQREAQRELEEGAAALQRPLASLHSASKFQAQAVAVTFKSLRKALDHPLIDNPNERAQEQQQYDLAIATLRRLIANR
jgi:tetratricopeptide (TPR) repeat protein